MQVTTIVQESRRGKVKRMESEIIVKGLHSFQSALFVCEMYVFCSMVHIHRGFCFGIQGYSVVNDVEIQRNTLG